MFGFRAPAMTTFALLAASCGLTATAEAQLFPWINPCNTCNQTAMVPAQVVAAPAIVSTAAVSDCPCMKPVTEMVYQDVQKVEYQPVQKVVKAAKVVTVMEDRPVTTYQTVNEARTVEVPTYVAHTVTEMQPVTVNQSYWQTQWQPVPKFSPCQYDNRPGLLGELNRMGYAMRNTFTPNYTARREFVPNVVASQVAVQRTVQVPTTRQVTYNVAKLVPVTTTQKVPVQRMVYEDQTVTAMVPVTTTQRVAVGTRTRMVYSGDLSTTASAANEPVPTAAKPSTNSASASEKGTTRFNSTPTKEAPIQYPTYHRDAEPTPDYHEAAKQPADAPAVASQTQPVIHMAGWRASRRPANEIVPAAGPELSIVQK